ncbi:MAG TPA: V-type ATP synthase subunit F [Sedimentisphaerales bacterium]|nr:V-type ATP synthase subunit F [Sedimentisphaerales bacterium]
MNGNVAVLGSVDFVMPFAALGLDTYPVGDSTDDAIKNAKAIIECKYALIVVAENIAKKTADVFAAVQKKTMPCVVVVPFTTEPEGFATKSLGDALKIATGINIFQNS